MSLKFHFSLIHYNNNEFFTYNSEKMIESVPTSELSGNEIKKETFEFVGNEIFNLTEIIKIISNEIRKKNIIIPIPPWLGKLQGAVLGLAPNPMLTLDQVRTLESGDNIATGNHRTLSDLEVNLHGIRNIVSNYLWRFRKGGQFAK